MSLGCAACGSCCDPVPFTAAQHEAVAKWATTALEGVPDPRTDDGWAHWLANGWPEEDRDTAIDHYDPDGRWRQDADFIAAHWAPEGHDHCTCDMFSPATRLCTAHDARPPVCRDYPWYRDGPTEDRAACLEGQCSYLLDVAPGDRPEGARPLIPVTVISRGRASDH